MKVGDYLIPNIPILTNNLTEITYPNRTYRIVFNHEEDTMYDNRRVLNLTMAVDPEKYDRISGYSDDLSSVIQAIYLILSTERYQYIIYSWDYGVELLDLFGQPMSYVMSEIPRRVTEALTQDDRIDDVIDFKFTKNKNKLHIEFTTVTTFGNVDVEMEVAT